MFEEELLKNDQQTHDIINNIMDILTDQNITKSHFRHIPTPVCMQSGLKVKYIEDDQELQDIILSIHHASTLTIVNTSSQNHRKSNGQSYISQYTAKSSNIARENKSLYL